MVRILFLHFAWVVDGTKCIVVTRICVSVCVCLSVCLSVRSHMPTLLHGPGCGLPPSCALLGGFAIGVRVALLWQHNANPSYKLVSIPWYDNIVRTLGGVCARCWPVTGGWRGVLKIACRIWEPGMAGWPVTGRWLEAFSTLLRRPGLRASNGGVLAT